MWFWTIAVLSGVLLAQFSVGQAHACSERKAISNDKVSAAVKTVQSSAPDDPIAVFALEELLCAKRPHVRNMALKTGLISPNNLVRSLALSEAVMELETVVVELDPDTKNATSLALSPRYRNRELNCISFNNHHKCDDNDVISINGIQVSIEKDRHQYTQHGRFSLNKEGNLVGTWSNPVKNERYTAKIVINDR